jgi:hypothetical protein
MSPAQGDEDMLPSMRRLFPAVLLLTGSAALADSPLPGSDVPTREVVTRTPVETVKSDEQLRVLTREIQSLEAEVQKLQTKVSEQRAVHEVEFLDQTDHKLWP